MRERGEGVIFLSLRVVVVERRKFIPKHITRKIAKILKTEILANILMSYNSRRVFSLPNY